MDKARKHLVDWLRDAHGMEKQAIELLEKQAKRLENYPDMQARVRQHTEETRRQAERIEMRLKQLDAGGSSAVKDFIGSLTGNLGAMTNAMASDEVVKNAIGNYAFEHFEIACYRSLIEAADLAGDRETGMLCREILREEEDMAAWVDEHLPMTTRLFIERDILDETAKR